MGSWFSNIQIRRIGEMGLADAEKIAEFLVGGRDYVRADESDADIVVSIIMPQDGQWISVASDIFDGVIDTQISCAREFSSEFGTQAMAISCFDSDYLFLNLIDMQKNVDAWASCGKYPYGKAPGRSNFAAWKPYVSDVKAFREVMQAKQIFIEDCLHGIAPLLSLPAAQSSFGVSEKPDDVEIMNFFYKSRSEMASGNPPCFKVRSHDSYYGPGDTLVSFLNCGGASRGVSVYVGGPCIDKKQINVTGIALQIMNDRHGKLTRIPLDFRMETFSDGIDRLYSECTDIRILPAIPENLPPKKADEIAFLRGICVRVTLEPSEPYNILSKNLDDLDIVIAPLKNISGQSGVRLPYRRRDGLITEMLKDADLTERDIEYLCETLYDNINTEWGSWQCKEQLKVLLNNPSARKYDLKEFYERCLERCAVLALKIMLIRGYAMYAGEDEIAPVMKQFTKAFVKKQGFDDYEYVMSDGGLLYLMRTYGYDCFREAHEIISAQTPKNPFYNDRYSELNEKFEFVARKPGK